MPTRQHPPKPSTTSTSKTSTSTAIRKRRVVVALAVAALSVVVAACGPRASQASSADVMEAIDAAFGPYGQTQKAIRVAKCESGLNPNAGYPDAYYKGLFQLGPHIKAIHHYGGNWFDPYQNAAAARDLYVTRGGWSAWPYCGNV